jgi:flagellar motor component MotA
MLLNHVKLVVNLTNSYTPNYYQHYGINYLSPRERPTLNQYDELC